jgi:molecular chaperone HscC
MTTVTKPPIVGIDLGTTYSLVSVMQGGRPILIPNAIDELLTPSAVSIDEQGQLLVGAPARARAVTHPDRTVLAFKRDMGTARTYPLGSRSFQPQELSSLVLSALKRDAEHYLGMPIEEAVVTVPAYFGDLQRQATRDAGAIAGLRVQRIINEPTAAALAYGLQHQARELKAVVLDLGGGTFDVTVLEIMEGVVEIQTSAGNARLGGEDFTDRLAALIEQRLAGTWGASYQPPPVARARIREACEAAKKRLGSAPSADVALPALRLNPTLEHDVSETITREEAEARWTDLIDQMRLTILRALRDASLRPEQLEEVLLVGGATRMPCVRALAARLFGRLPLQHLPPDETVAMGAAIQAALVEGDASVDDLVVTDVAPFSMGIETAHRVGAQHVGGLFTPILERGTVIPASRVRTFSTMEDGQTRLELKVFQGEHPLCENNVLLGTYMIRNLPSRPAGETGIHVRFPYDLNGILEVEMEIDGTGRKETLTIEKQPGRLTADQLKRAREEMARLKVHPRETLPNRTAQARADTLYAELTGEPRERLGAAIAHFQGALERQDPALIDEARELLLSVVAALARQRG